VSRVAATCRSRERFATSHPSGCTSCRLSSAALPSKPVTVPSAPGLGRNNPPADRDVPTPPPQDEITIRYGHVGGQENLEIAACGAHGRGVCGRRNAAQVDLPSIEFSRERESQGLKLKELSRAQELAEENRAIIIEKWHEHIG
jgi:hypothetical protein